MCVGGSLEDEVYDAIIVGTGLSGSILSAALSLAGTRVLHLDPNDFYGSQHASLPLKRIAALVAELRSASTAGDTHSTLFGPNTTSAVAESADESALNRVVIDLTPRTLLAGGPLVDILVQTGVGHYLSFRPIDASYLCLVPTTSHTDDLQREIRIERVPASRSDVFRSKFLSMVEKRLLMRFLKSTSPSAALLGPSGNTLPLSTDSHDIANDQSFEDLMADAGLTTNLQQFLKHCIVFADDYDAELAGGTISATDACRSIDVYMKSLARYGTPTPFLYPNYGCGEICEAFCRLSAVHGGTFALRRGISKISRVDKKLETLRRSASDGSQERNTDHETLYKIETTEGDKVKARCIFSSVPRASSDLGHSLTGEGSVWRQVHLLDSPAYIEATPRVVVVYPQGTAGNTHAAVRVLQVNHTPEVCPEGYFLLYAETMGEHGTEEDVSKALSTVIDLHAEIRNADDTVSVEMSEMSAKVVGNVPRKRPCSLWTLSFQRRISLSTSLEDNESDTDAGIMFIPDPPSEIDASRAIGVALECFTKLRPKDQFFRQNSGKEEDTGTASGE